MKNIEIEIDFSTDGDFSVDNPSALAVGPYARYEAGFEEYSWRNTFVGEDAAKNAKDFLSAVMCSIRVTPRNCDMIGRFYGIFAKAKNHINNRENYKETIGGNYEGTRVLVRFVEAQEGDNAVTAPQKEERTVYAVIANRNVYKMRKQVSEEYWLLGIKNTEREAEELQNKYLKVHENVYGERHKVRILPVSMDDEYWGDDKIYIGSWYKPVETN